MKTPNISVDEGSILLRPRQAAASLSISERQLWQHTVPRGPIPCVRIGNCVRYSPDALQAFIRNERSVAAQSPNSADVADKDQCQSHHAPSYSDKQPSEKEHDHV